MSMKNKGALFFSLFLFVVFGMSMKGQTYNEVPWNLQTDSLCNLMDTDINLRYWFYKVEPRKNVVTQIDDGFYSYRGMGPHFRQHFFIRHKGKMYVYNKYGIDETFRFFSDFIVQSGISDSLTVIYYGYIVRYMFNYHSYDWYQEMSEQGMVDLWPQLFKTSYGMCDLYFCFYVLSHCRPQISTFLESISMDHLSDFFCDISDRIEEGFFLEDGHFSYENYLSFSLKLADCLSQKFPIYCDILDYLDDNRLKQIQFKMTSDF